MAGVTATHVRAELAMRHSTNSGIAGRIVMPTFQVKQVSAPLFGMIDASNQQSW
jgi:hypothetical protein